ncbi:MAG: STAS domain-containing protein [Atopobiaceae bacterium]|nr:STAS domain-containing protein [Atopobiaceae bacterium]
MEITTNIDESLAKIAVSGKLTVATSPELEKAIQELPGTVSNIDIDLTDLEYISSAGLRVLVSAQKLTTQRDGTLRLLHPTQDVYEVFEMTGLSEVITIVKA